jgi:hypothetical protein
MAKTCWLERDKRKRKTVEKYAKLRAELKAKGDYVGLSCFPVMQARHVSSTAAASPAVVARSSAASRCPV